MEKLTLRIKGLYIYSTKEAKNIPVVAVWEENTFLFDVQFSLNNANASLTTLVTFIVF